MRFLKLWAVVCLFLAGVIHAQGVSRMVTVERGVKLEVVDWGGTGRPLVLVPGLGDTAHVFDKFAVKLTGSYHVYGITTRGFGVSSKPEAVVANYSADRLGADVVAVIVALKLERPVLAGHSIAGEVLSAVAASHPEKIAGLVYIDAGYQYALYDVAHGDLVIDALELRKSMDAAHLGTLPRDPKTMMELLAATEQAAAEMEQRKADLATISPPNPIKDPAQVAVLDGEEKFTAIEVPALAIFNVPHSAAFRRLMENQVKAFEVQAPQVKIYRIENADHYVFETNADDVAREMIAFGAGLHVGN